MKISEFGWIGQTSASLESTKLTTASNQFQSFFQSLAKNDAAAVKLPEKSDAAASKDGLQSLLKTLTNLDMTTLEDASSIAGTGGEKGDAINILHAIVGKWDPDADFSEQTLQQMTETTEKAFSAVEKKLHQFFQDFSFENPSENMFAETSLPELVHALKGIQLAGAETALLQNPQKVNETVDALTQLVSQLINQINKAAESKENNSDAPLLTDTEDLPSGNVKAPEQQPIEGIGGYEELQTNDKLSPAKGNPPIHAVNDRMPIEADTVFSAETKPEQSILQKDQDARASNELLNRIEPTNQRQDDELFSALHTKLANQQPTGTTIEKNQQASSKSLAEKAPEAMDGKEEQESHASLPNKPADAFWEQSVFSSTENNGIHVMEMPGSTEIEASTNAKPANNQSKRTNPFPNDMRASVLEGSAAGEERNRAETIGKQAEQPAASSSSAGHSKGSIDTNGNSKANPFPLAMHVDEVNTGANDDRAFLQPEVVEKQPIVKKAPDMASSLFQQKEAENKSSIPKAGFAGKAAAQPAFNQQPAKTIQAAVPVSQKTEGDIKDLLVADTWQEQKPGYAEENNKTSKIAETLIAEGSEKTNEMAEIPKFVPEASQYGKASADSAVKAGILSETASAEGSEKTKKAAEMPKFVPEASKYGKVSADSAVKAGTLNETASAEGSEKTNEMAEMPKFVPEASQYGKAAADSAIKAGVLSEPASAEGSEKTKKAAEMPTAERKGQINLMGQQIKFNQAAAPLQQENPKYDTESGNKQQTESSAATQQIKDSLRMKNAAARINPLVGQFQQIREGNSLHRFRNQSGAISIASEANSESNRIQIPFGQEMPIANREEIEATASAQSRLQPKQKGAMPFNQQMPLDTVKLINPLLYQTPKQPREIAAKEQSQDDAIIQNGVIQASSAAIIEETTTKVGQNGQTISGFPYQPFFGRTDKQIKAASQSENLTDRGEREEAQPPLNNIKSLVSSIIDKLNTAAQKEEKPNVMFAKMATPLMVGSIKKTTAAESKTSEKLQPAMEKSEAETKTVAVGQMQTAFAAKQQEPLALLTASGSPVSAHQLREQLEKVLANGKFVNNGDNQTFTIRLAPDHLGSIKIEIQQNEGNISAKILTASQEAKEVLETHLTSIKHSLSSQQGVVDKLDIAYTPSQQEKTTKDNQQQQQQQQQQQKEEQSSQKKEQEKQRKTFLEELLNME